MLLCLLMMHFIMYNSVQTLRLFFSYATAQTTCTYMAVRKLFTLPYTLLKTVLIKISILFYIAFVNSKLYKIISIGITLKVYLFVMISVI